jgi:multicomponent Na+:H+ antiporter subunit D
VNTLDAALLAVPVTAPLLAAGLLVLLPARTSLHRSIATIVMVAALAVAATLVARTADGTVLTQDLGGWPPGVAIVLVADTLAAMLLSVTAVLVLVCLGFAAATGNDEHRLFVPLALVLTAGVNGAYLTADLFNLFVFIEVMLVPSYVLLVMGGGTARLAAGRLYITVNLLASTIFLAGLGLVYGVTGTVNLGELAGAAADPAVAVAVAVVLLAMVVKAGVVPLHGWLPRSYSHAPPAVTALFSGLLTKVGVYAIMRIYAVVYDGDQRYLWLVMTAALLTMVVGVLGAVGEKAVRPVLTLHMVSQVGYILVGLALFTQAGLAAGIFFFVQYVLVKAALLICVGAVEHTYGTGDLDRLGGLVTRQPLLAAGFAVAALSLVGIPPLSGFVAKLALVSAAVAQADYLAAATVVVVSLFTLMSMLKIWNGVFWGATPEPAAGADLTVTVRTRVAAALAAPALVLALLSMVLGVGAEPLLAISEVAAEGLVDTSGYVEAVTGP